MGAIYTFTELINNTSFIRFCSGEDAQAKADWEAYLVANPDQKAVIDDARKFVLALRGVLKKQEAAYAWNELENLAYNQPTIQPLRNKTRSIFLWAGSAAAVLLAVVSSVYLLRTPAGGGERTSPDQTVYQSLYGERQTFRLPDDTRVVLRGNSRLTITADFSLKNRLVQLQGDAFFDVAQKSSLPFSVRSGVFDVTALGTSFWIDHDETQHHTVGLLGGKVKVDMLLKGREQPLSIVLDPGQLLTADSALTGYVGHTFDLQQTQQWLAAELNFHNADAAKIAATLTDWYGTPVYVEGKPASRVRFNGTFKDEHLDKVLQVISFSTGAKIKYRETSIFLTF